MSKESFVGSSSTVTRDEGLRFMSGRICNPVPGEPNFRHGFLSDGNLTIETTDLDFDGEGNEINSMLSLGVDFTFVKMWDGPHTMGGQAPVYRLSFATFPDLEAFALAAYGSKDALNLDFDLPSTWVNPLV